MQKKIAVAFFGIPRSSKDCIPSIEENIIGRLVAAGAQAKIFYHLFDLSHITNTRSNENHELDKTNYDYFKQYDGELESPGLCLENWGFDKVKAYGDYWNDGYQSLSNLIHQLYSLHMVTRRITAFGPDLVAFVRPDLIYHDKIKKSAIEQCIKFPNSVVLPSWQWWGGYNDRFALCGKSSYHAYGERILNVAKYCQIRNRPLHAENFLKYSLDEKGCRIVPTKFRGSRVRVSGDVVHESFNGLRTAGTVSSALNLISRSVLSKLKH